MSLSHSPSIVTNGLVLALDAANIKSYSGSGTAWTDLSGNSNTGTLTNGPTFSSSNNGSIVFDGVNDYISASASSSFQFGTNNFTVSFWVYFNASPNNYALYDNLILGGIGARNDAFVLLVNATGKLDVFTVGSFRGVSSTTLVSKTWYNIVLTRTSGVWNYYFNGVLDSASFTNTVNLTSGGCIIGRISDTSGYFINGAISQVSIYNRALSATEISQNYNATRGRYNV
jgi:hypothetical protein